MSVQTRPTKLVDLFASAQVFDGLVTFFLGDAIGDAAAIAAAVEAEHEAWPFGRPAMDE